MVRLIKFINIITASVIFFYRNSARPGGNLRVGCRNPMLQSLVHDVAHLAVDLLHQGFFLDKDLEGARLFIGSSRGELIV